jgi:hypothetical protein
MRPCPEADRKPQASKKHCLMTAILGCWHANSARSCRKGV